MKLQVHSYTDKNEMVEIRELVRDEHYQVIARTKMKLLKTVLVRINGETIIIKAGGFWNGATIPKIFWGLIGQPSSQKFALASLVHDELYEMRYNRDTADDVFRKLLDWAGVNGRRVALMWSAVRLGGHMFYAARAKNNKLSTRIWRGIVKKFYGN